MSWRFVWSDGARRQLRKLDRSAVAQIDEWVTGHFMECENPRAFGKRLTGNLSHLWRYRVGDYRLLCTFDNDELIVLAVEVGHRRDVYARRNDRRRR